MRSDVHEEVQTTHRLIRRAFRTLVAMNLDVVWIAVRRRVRSPVATVPRLNCWLKTWLEGISSAPLAPTEIALVTYRVRVIMSVLGGSSLDMATQTIEGTWEYGKGGRSLYRRVKTRAAGRNYSDDERRLQSTVKRLLPLRGCPCLTIAPIIPGPLGPLPRLPAFSRQPYSGGLCIPTPESSSYRPTPSSLLAF